MRSIRTIALAALAATAVLAAIGVGTASASKEVVFCKVNVEVCTGSNVAGYAFTSTPTTEAKFDFGESGKFQCTSQMFRHETELITGLSFSSCSEGCAVTVSGLPAASDLYEPIAGNSKMNLWLGGFNVKCGSAECAYAGTVTGVTVKGGTPAHVEVDNSLAEKGGNPLCPSTVQWEADYKFQTPSAATYVTARGAEGPLFCSVNETPCPQELPEEAARLFNSFPLATGTQMVFGKVPGGSNITCNEGGLALNDFEPFVANAIWSYKPWGYSNCTSSVFTECTFGNPNPPYAGKLTPSGGGNGSITVSQWEGRFPTFTQSCKSAGTPFTCTYATTSFSMKFTGGKPALLTNVIALKRTAGSATFCSSEVTLAASYEPKSEGGALYMVSS